MPLSEAVTPSPSAAGRGVPAAAAAAWAVPCVGLGCPSRAVTEPVDTDGWAGVKARLELFPGAAEGGCGVLVLNMADGDMLVPRDLPAPLSPALVLVSAGLVLCPVLVCENSPAGAGEGAGELADIPAWVTTARTLPEIGVFLWTSVESGACSGAGVGLRVVIKG